MASSLSPREAQDPNPSENDPAQAQNSKWVDLPGDILVRIIRHLDLHTDLSRLRGVCPQWRSLLPLHEFRPVLHLFSRPLPLPPLPPNPIPSPLLVPIKYYFLSPLSDQADGRWLARMGPMGPGRCHVFNPFNLHDYFFAYPPVTGSLSLLDCRIQELSTVYCILDPDSDKAEPLSKKVVGGWNLSARHRFAVLCQLERQDGLALWRFGDNDWTKIGGGDSRFVDIASHKGKFYALELYKWSVGVMDPEAVGDDVEADVSVDFFPAPDILGDDGNFTVSFHGVSYLLCGVYLVSSGENLYLVAEVEGRPPGNAEGSILVFLMREKQEEGGGKDDVGKRETNTTYSWENVTHLGDQIFFIGYDAAFALPSASVNLPHWKTNSICLFTRPFPLIFDCCMEGLTKKVPEGLKCLESVNFAKYYRYIRMFTMGEEDTHTGVVPFEKLPRERYTGLFFPPPPWVRWRCPDRGNALVDIHEIKFTDTQEMFRSLLSVNERSMMLMMNE